MTVKQVIFLMDIKNIPFISLASNARKDGKTTLGSDPMTFSVRRAVS